VPFTFDDQVPKATFLLDGKQVKATIDTGATTTVLDHDLAESMFGFKVDGPGVEKIGKSYSATGSIRDDYRTKFRSLDFSGVAVSNPVIRVSDLDGREMILGMNHLSMLRVYFAFAEKVMYVTPAGSGR
jgi:predicted aspartyl protease